jgi:hypothetical protein
MRNDQPQVQRDVDLRRFKHIEPEWLAWMLEVRDLWASPQNPHKSASAGRLPTKSPRTRRHSPARRGTAATMASLALASLYADSAGLTILELPVARRLQASS